MPGIKLSPILNVNIRILGVIQTEKPIFSSEILKVFRNSQCGAVSNKVMTILFRKRRPQTIFPAEVHCRKHPVICIKLGHNVFP